MLRHALYYMTIFTAAVLHSGALDQSANVHFSQNRYIYSQKYGHISTIQVLSTSLQPIEQKTCKSISWIVSKF